MDSFCLAQKCFFLLRTGSLTCTEVPVLPPRWALVLGSEHHGVRSEVREVCQMRLKARVPCSGCTSLAGACEVRMAEGVDSLNVMTSAGVLIHGCLERERRGGTISGPKKGVVAACNRSLNALKRYEKTSHKLSARYTVPQVKNGYGLILNKPI